MIGLLSPIREVFDRLVKGCHLAMHNAALLANENIALSTANQRQKQKRSKPVSSISQGGVLTVQEGRDRTENVYDIEATVAESSGPRSRKKALSTLQSLFLIRT